jgi:hypothetical protein
MFAAKYGTLALLVTRFRDEGDSRDWVVQSPSIGDQHVLQDRGLQQGRTSCELVFCDEPHAGSYLDRFLAFRELARSPVPQLFTHPIHGAYEAVVADLQPEVDADERCVRVSCAFLANDEPQPVAQVGAGVVASVGPEAVAVRASATTGALRATGQASAAPAVALTSVTAWAELEDPDARAIGLEVASIAGSIDAEVQRLELAADLRRWPAYRSFMLLRYSVVRAAGAVTSETQRVTTVTLEVAEPLLSLCARVYPVREAQERARQVAKINGLRTPGLVPAGTTIKLPAVAR